MKSHQVWWPHLDRAPIFNPFIPVTERRATNDRIEFPEAEESAGAEARADAETCAGAEEPTDAEAPAQAQVPPEGRTDR